MQVLVSAGLFHQLYSQLTDRRHARDHPVRKFKNDLAIEPGLHHNTATLLLDLEVARI